ncbi:hypothetical protein OG992_18695 [Micromonospora sp. NBC_00362]|uniref:hypothetical protein n=1 Tax=Micromonospora sp. NBC_00362 TaxID=2975975 RepID=UPI00225755AE|nr:hypothetical protein [Micromonospora sp. NBC_00362]MCX5119218.1 hypothetical protein [Micromonospora sp. NBC_00362]
MDLTLDDVRQLALELWLAQREAAMLRAENAQLRAQASSLDQPEPRNRACGEVHPGEDVHHPDGHPAEVTDADPRRA